MAWAAGLVKDRLSR